MLSSVTKTEKITSLWWSQALGEIGSVVTDKDDIDQCIRIILSTKKRDDPHRPDFGSNIWLYIDYPINVISAFIIKEVVEALTKFEPRIALVDVIIELPDKSTPYHLTITVIWVLKTDALTNYSTVIYL